MQLSLRTKFLMPLLMGGAVTAFVGAWASHEAALGQLRDQVVKRGELLGAALNEAAKATQSDDEIRFAVEEIVGKESSVFGIAVATQDPTVIWASSFRPGTGEDALTQSMLLTLRQTLNDGVFGHYFTPDGDLVTLVPLSPRAAALASAVDSRAEEGSSATDRSNVADSPAYPWQSRFTVPDPLFRGAIYLRFDWDSVKQASGNILWRSVIIMLAGIALMGILAYWLLYRTVLKPMAIIGAAMQHQKQGKAGVRVPALEEDEIGRFGMMLNQMLDTVLERDRRFRTVVDNLPIAIRLTDTEGRYDLKNARFEQLFCGRGTDEFGSLEPECSALDDSLSDRAQQERQVMDSGEPVTWEEQRLISTGERRVFVTSLFPVFNGRGHLDAIGKASTDITDRKRREDELRQFSKAVESAGNGILIADATQPDFPVVYVNPAVERLTGYPASEFLGRNARFLHGEETNQPGLEDIRAALEEGRGCRAILRNFRKDGSLFWNDFTLSPVYDTAGAVTHYVGIQSDITEHKEAEEHIQALAFFDTLTKIPNRTLFRDRLQQALTHAERNGQSLGLLYLDLDNFKAVNDSLGHSTGDRLLQIVTKRVVACVRQWDTVARVGGDEFTIIVDNLSPADTVRTLTGIAEKVLAVLSEPVTIEEQEIIVTASIGIAHYPQDGDTVEDLVKNADTAMYHSKSLGRDNCQFFLSQLDVAAKERQLVEAQLHHALRRGEMGLEYQPQVDLTTGFTCGVEVLLRWTNPVLGSVQPDTFIPAAESTGVIVRLGEWVLRQACDRFAHWQSLGLSLPRFSVNLSPRQFRQSEFVSRVSRILDESFLEPASLELEVTESSIIHDPEIAVAMLQDLKRLGVRVAMDDFGTGYSSLRYLRELPIDVVKIDKSFVGDIPVDPDNVEIVTAIIAMAKGLKMEVIAEGVETAEQLAALKALGCDKVQGRICSRPLSEEEFLRWMDISMPRTTVQRR
ncbi:MAG: EAL domain-containing protein [Gammaproteobacteria bacterium]|nr:EAL domain-containing protein [Gammaproteobacteria bacterium]